MKKILGIVFLLCSLQAQANIVINGTRVIYPETNKSVLVQLVNNGDAPSLVQAWIDDGDINSTPETADVPFLLSPPVVKVNVNNGQQLRIEKQASELPSDRESVFYLNVLDIPPTPEHLKDKNTLQLAIKSRIKMFYRPSKLVKGADKAINQLLLKASGKNLTVTNNSPYYITVASLSESTRESLIDSFMIAPFSQEAVSAKQVVKNNKQYKIVYIDDFGAYLSKDILIQ